MNRPFKHMRTEVGSMGEIILIHLGSYGTLAAAIAAAQKADRGSPDDTREVRWFRWPRRNRYNHGPAANWRDD